MIAGRMQGTLRRTSLSMRAAVLLSALLVVSRPAWAVRSDPWLDGLRSFTPGESAGFGAASLPFIILGPPRGGGPLYQSLDVASLGNGGTITVVFRDNVVVDEPGADLVIYENAFHVGSETGPIFAELGIVELSADGKTWVTYPYDAESGEGLAGRTPVAAAELDINPLSEAGGGDRFDIAEAGLSYVRFVRITDGGDDLPDPGNMVPPADKGGFDLDAMGAIHSSPTAVVRGVVTSGGEPVAGARVVLLANDNTRRLVRRSRSDGSFRFRPLLPAGDYTVRARAGDAGSAEAVAHVDVENLVADVELALE